MVESSGGVALPVEGEVVGAWLGAEIREGWGIEVVADRFRAVSRTETTLSTRRIRLRCRSFWGAESRHGIFLEYC